MKQLSIIPEIFIWLAFLVLTGFGYAFTFFEYIGGRAEMTVTDIVVSILVWLVLAVACICLLRGIRSVGERVTLSGYQTIFLEVSILILLLFAGWAFRFAEPFRGIWPSDLDNKFFEIAQVGQNEYWRSYKSSHPASRVYIYFLHFVFLLIGNIYEAGILAQCVLLLIGAAFWYLTVKKSLGVTVSLFFMAGTMLLPDSIVASMQYNPIMLLFAFYGVIAWLLVLVSDSKGLLWVTTLGAFFVGIFAGVAPLMDISGWLLVFISLFAWGKQWQRHQGKGLVVVIAGVLGTISGFVVCGFTMYQFWVETVKRMAPFLGMGDMALHFPLTEQLAAIFGYRNVYLQLPDLEQIQQFVFSLSNRPVFIAAITIIASYWFLRKRTVCTWIMTGILVLFGFKLFALDIHMQYDFLIYLCFLLLLGATVQQFILIEDVYKEKLSSVTEDSLEQKYSRSSVLQDVKGDTTELPDLSAIDNICRVERTELFAGTHSTERTIFIEPEVTTINFDEACAVMVPEKVKEKSLVFIPKSMEIPKRLSKPKVEYAMEVTEELMHFDVGIDENADFDI